MPPSRTDLLGPRLPVTSRYSSKPELKELYDTVADVFAEALKELMQIREKYLSGSDLSRVLASFQLVFSSLMRLAYMTNLTNCVSIIRAALKS